MWHIKTFNELSLDELYALLKVRNQVFIVEQNAVYQDLDGDDQAAIHIWKTEGGTIKSMARVTPAGKHLAEDSIGRIITTERGKGLGLELVRKALEVAHERLGAKRILIQAQEQAKGFYEKIGFVAISKPYMHEGLPHLDMTYTF
ncbi:MAG: GNAT family N-acetyltransferase [Marinilabiliaceae bacterium]